MDMVIASIIIISGMLFFIFVMFRSIIKRINQNAKKYFINKLDDYDEMVKEKEAQIEELNKVITGLTKEKENLEKNKEIFYLHLPKREKDVSSKLQINFKSPKFREENFFSNYKELKKKFDFDKEELIKEFIKEHQDKKTERDYKTLKNFKNKFDKEAIYQLTTLPGQEQLEILKMILTDKEKKLIDLENIVEDKSKFSILLLFEKVDQMLVTLDPTINIYVSKYDKDYDYIDPYIKTLRYSKMSEGIIIEYKGKSYDFSI